MDARQAFDTLLGIVDEELHIQQRRGAAYLGEGDTDHAREVIRQVENLKTLAGKVQQLQMEWEGFFPVEPPEEVIPEAPEARRTPPGQKTPQECYWIPILQALIEMSGKGRAGIVIDQVGGKMTGILNDFDYQNLPGRSEIRWRNTAAWARNDLVKTGYLSDKSPKGVWEITEEGRSYLKNRKVF